MNVILVKVEVWRRRRGKLTSIWTQRGAGPWNSFVDSSWRFQSGKNTGSIVGCGAGLIGSVSPYAEAECSRIKSDKLRVLKRALWPTRCTLLEDKRMVWHAA